MMLRLTTCLTALLALPVLAILYAMIFQVYVNPTLATP